MMIRILSNKGILNIVTFVIRIKFMMTFEQIKVSLPDKWLDYYQINRCWIKPLMDSRNLWKPIPNNGGKRPCADIILGAITALEPELAYWIPPFCEIEPNQDKFVKVLGLDFDPETELNNREEERAKNPQFNSSDTDEIERIRQQLSKGEL
ncbi:conserved hypothetical protein [Crocosphaera subtropica ATCC 51142]|uniref:Uncharacterized protein n=2 Tax=Crocosphaera TaxID=263510 RepID=B1WV91_CROS5|nr:conserved hypothetical protein [Crocosphaera subtropica ATCC 51142]